MPSHNSLQNSEKSRYSRIAEEPGVARRGQGSEAARVYLTTPHISPQKKSSKKKHVTPFYLSTNLDSPIAADRLRQAGRSTVDAGFNPGNIEADVKPSSIKPIVDVRNVWHIERKLVIDLDPDSDHKPYLIDEKTYIRTDVKVIDRASLKAWAQPGYIPRSPASVQIWADGSLIKVKRNATGLVGNQQGNKGLTAKEIERRAKAMMDGVGFNAGGKRGRVRGFSEGSRRRLRYTLNKLKTSLHPLFVTLTYPNDWPHDSKQWKRDLDVFIKRLRRKFKPAAGIWKLEPQKRGAPHFHFFLWGVDAAELKAWIRQAWFEVVGSGDSWHLLKGADVEPIRSPRGARAYAAKYITKVVTPDNSDKENPWDYPGRWWGSFNDEGLPWAEEIKVELTEAEAIVLIRTMRKYAKLKSRDYRSLSIVVNDASWWFNRLDDLIRWRKPSQ